LISNIPQKPTSPYIPENIYDVLPPTLKEACNVFKGRERDVLFTSALTVISGGLYNVSGLYANDKVFPNLFSIIIAPPASGKGVMKYSRQLGYCSHDFLLNQSREDLKEYKKEKRIFDLKVKKAKELIEGDYLRKYNIEALAKACGFKATNSFYRIFKNETGLTPKMFLENLS